MKAISRRLRLFGPSTLFSCTEIPAGTRGLLSLFISGCTQALVFDSALALQRSKHFDELSFFHRVHLMHICWKVPERPATTVHICMRRSVFSSRIDYRLSLGRLPAGKLKDGRVQPDKNSMHGVNHPVGIMPPPICLHVEGMNFQSRSLTLPDGVILIITIIIIVIFVGGFYIFTN